MPHFPIFPFLVVEFFENSKDLLNLQKKNLSSVLQDFLSITLHINLVCNEDPPIISKYLPLPLIHNHTYICNFHKVDEISWYNCTGFWAVRLVLEQHYNCNTARFQSGFQAMHFVPMCLLPLLVLQKSAEVGMITVIEGYQYKYNDTFHIL